VYCEGVAPIAPIPLHHSMTALGLVESRHFIMETGVAAPGPLRVDDVALAPGETVSYCSMIRPGGEASVAQYLERITEQLLINVYRVGDPLHAAVTVSAPGILAVTELPRFLLFATRDAFDHKADTIQVFRRKVESDLKEVMRYTFRGGVALRSPFVSEQMRARKGHELMLFYDIVHGFTPERLASMAVRTCDVYDRLIHRRQRMLPDASLESLGQYIRKKVMNCAQGRFLVDDDGLVHRVRDDEVIEKHHVPHFDAVPEDQQNPGRGEFLVVMAVYRASRHRQEPIDMRESFLFTVIPGEIAAAANRLRRPFI